MARYVEKHIDKAKLLYSTTVQYLSLHCDMAGGGHTKKCITNTYENTLKRYSNRIIVLVFGRVSNYRVCLLFKNITL